MQDAALAVEQSVLSLAADREALREESATSTSEDAQSPQVLDILAASEWPNISAAAVLLSPLQCRTLWRQFISDSNSHVQQVWAYIEKREA